MVQTATALLACGRHRDGAAGAGLSGLHAAHGRQLRAELLDRRDAVLVRAFSWTKWRFRSSWRGGCGSWTGWATSTSFRLSSARRRSWCSYAPITQQERWEETAGYSPSTLAAVISGLICAADIARAHESDGAGRLSRELCRLDRSASRRVDHDDRRRAAAGGQAPLHADPSAGAGRAVLRSDRLPPGMIHIDNREPGEKQVFEAREIIDAGFLELVRYGIRRADDPLIVDSLKVVDQVSEDRDAVRPLLAALQPRWLRAEEGWRPVRGLGTGTRVAAADRRARALRACRRTATVAPLITAIEQFSSIGGMLPEQVWDYADLPSEGHVLRQVRRVGAAAGLGARGVPEAAALGHRRPGLRPHLGGGRALRGRRAKAHVHQPDRDLPGRPPDLVDSGGLTLRIVDRGHFRRCLYLRQLGDGQRIWTRTAWAVSATSPIFRRTAEQSGNDHLYAVLAWSQGQDQPDRWLGRNLEVIDYSAILGLQILRMRRGCRSGLYTVIERPKSSNSRFAAPRRVSSHRKRKRMSDQQQSISSMR